MGEDSGSNPVTSLKCLWTFDEPGSGDSSPDLFKAKAAAVDGCTVQGKFLEVGK